uniref:Uncharacterized protein n=1 Tax=Oryctolagus cuniculus TaxID=9986 RepID=A0A5F9CED3_RABIT
MESGAVTMEVDCTLFVGNTETKVTEELLFELFHQTRMSVCHSATTMLETQALPPHPLAADMKGLWLTWLHQHRKSRDFSLLQKITRDKQ